MHCVQYMKRTSLFLEALKSSSIVNTLLPPYNESSDVGYIFRRAECEHRDIMYINILGVSCCTHTFK